jgi:hypothetical protein
MPLTKIDTLVIDASIKEEHEAEIEITKHAVEKGVKITDHARPKPRVITVDAIVSNTPITPAQITQMSLGMSPAQSARAFLLDLWKTPRIVTITTGIEVYRDMLMASHKETRDAKTGDVYLATMKFEEVRFVTGKTTVVATKQVKGKGKVSKSTTSKPAPTAMSRRLTTTLTGAGIAVPAGGGGSAGGGH